MRESLLGTDHSISWHSLPVTTPEDARGQHQNEEMAVSGQDLNKRDQDGILFRTKIVNYSVINYPKFRPLNEKD